MEFACSAPRVCGSLFRGVVPVMIDWKMLIPVLICGIALGYHLGTTITQKEVEELKEQHFHLLAEIQQKTGEEYAALADKLQEREKTLAAALDARDRAVAVADSLRADARRVREQADRAGQRLSSLPRADSPACQRDRERLARCVGLLGEGVELAGEGAGLSLRTAADKDAIGVR